MHTTLTLLHHVLAAGSSGSTKKKGNSLYPFIILLALGGVAYFTFIRPARNRQLAAVSAKRNVEVGDEVTTTAGLIATVTAIDDDYLTLEIAPGVHCKYVPAAILRVNGADDEPDGDSPDASNHEVIEDPDASSTATESHDDPTVVTDTTEITDPNEHDDGSAPA